MTECVLICDATLRGCNRESAVHRVYIVSIDAEGKIVHLDFCTALYTGEQNPCTTHA